LVSPDQLKPDSGEHSMDDSRNSVVVGHVGASETRWRWLVHRHTLGHRKPLHLEGLGAERCRDCRSPQWGRSSAVVGSPGM
jgi:hypothetical protein